MFIAAFIYEYKTSNFQSTYFHKIASKTTWQVKSGPSNLIIFPTYGPQDIRLGYTSIPKIIQTNNWNIVSQADWSPELFRLVNRGIFPPYETKQSYGLRIFDINNQNIYSSSWPRNRIDVVPALVINVLTFIEDRDILNESGRKNPVVNPLRLAKAASTYAMKKLKLSDDRFGASTLPTQLVKFRHSNNGITRTAKDKLLQMFSASLLAYKDSIDTTKFRQSIINQFINSVPLGSIPNYGEVFGMSEGLERWFGSNSANKILAVNECHKDFCTCGESLRQFISLIVAQRRPSYFMKHHNELDILVEKHLSLLLKEQVVPTQTAECLFKRPVYITKFSIQPESHKLVSDPVRFNLINKLDTKNVYNLDRYDLRVDSTINADLSVRLSNTLKDIRNSSSLNGKYLLRGKNQKFVVSFLLFERNESGNVLRVQIDEFPTRFSLNDGMKMELGSTAKLRVLTSYLQLVEKTFIDLKENPYPIHSKDALSRWVYNWILNNPEGRKIDILNSAIYRKFSGTPGSFFTGGGLHHFSNFEGKGSGPITAREGLVRSINLVYIRILEDIIKHLRYRGQDGINEDRVLANEDTIRRSELLNSFIEKEGNYFLFKFYKKYKQSSNPVRDLLVEMDAKDKGLSPIIRGKRIGAVLRVWNKNISFNQFSSYLSRRISLSNKQLDRLYKSIFEGNFDLQDFGYMARKHPLELWTVSYLLTHKEANFNNLKEASKNAIKQTYRWLYDINKKKRGQDKRISIILEERAFEKLTPLWRNVGYPFKVFPSLASAIGSSGDRPNALAKLMGILIRNGMECPVQRINKLSFATSTPYETVLAPKNICRRVISSEVSQVILSVISDVVNKGTAVRIKNTFENMGGKTGTGDNRIGRVAKNRTGTFVFHINQQYFGVITVHVDGTKSAHYSFTSSLPVQILKLMSKTLKE
jgi:membrane peptidoglycan carboxypeptidase